MKMYVEKSSKCEQEDLIKAGLNNAVIKMWHLCVVDSHKDSQCCSRCWSRTGASATGRRREMPEKPRPCCVRGVSCPILHVDLKLLAVLGSHLSFSAGSLGWCLCWSVSMKQILAGCQAICG